MSEDNVGGLGGLGGFSFPSINPNFLPEIMQAVGHSLMTSPNDAPFMNFSAGMAQARKGSEARDEQAAMRMILQRSAIQAGHSPEEAAKIAAQFSRSPAIGKLMLDQFQQQRADRQTQDYFKSGEEPAPAQSPTPAAPAPSPFPSLPQLGGNTGWRDAPKEPDAVSEPMPPGGNTSLVPMQSVAQGLPPTPAPAPLTPPQATPPMAAPAPLTPPMAPSYTQAPADSTNWAQRAELPAMPAALPGADAPPAAAPPPGATPQAQRFNAMAGYQRALKATASATNAGNKGLAEAAKLDAQRWGKWLEPNDAMKVLRSVGIDEQSPQGRAILLGTLTDNTPTSAKEARISLENPVLGREMDRRAVLGKDPQITDQIAQRRQGAVAQGLNPNDPNVKQFILTGRYPREDQQPLSATDKKFIAEADEAVLSASEAINALKQAKTLSTQAYAGPLAGGRGYTTSLFGAEGGVATTDLSNLVTSTALGQLKAIFGAAPTEGERKILLEIQGSVGQPDQVRQKIYDRGIALAERRLQFNQQRANELRGSTFYKPTGGTSGASKPAQPPAFEGPQQPPPGDGWNPAGDGVFIRKKQ